MRNKYLNALDLHGLDQVGADMMPDMQLMQGDACVM